MARDAAFTRAVRRLSFLGALYQTCLTIRVFLRTQPKRLSWRFAGTTRTVRHSFKTSVGPSRSLSVSSGPFLTVSFPSNPTRASLPQAWPSLRSAGWRKLPPKTLRSASFRLSSRRHIRRRSSSTSSTRCGCPFLPVASSANAACMRSTHFSRTSSQRRHAFIRRISILRSSCSRLTRTVSSWRIFVRRTSGGIEAPSRHSGRVCLVSPSNRPARLVDLPRFCAFSQPTRRTRSRRQRRGHV